MSIRAHATFEAVKLTLIDGLEAGLPPVVEASGELNLGDRAATEVADGTRAGRRGGGGGRGCRGRGRSSRCSIGGRGGDIC